MSLVQNIIPSIEELEELEEDLISDLAMLAYCNPDNDYIKLVKKEMKKRKKIMNVLDGFYELNESAKIFCDAYEALERMIEENDFSDAGEWHQALVCVEPNNYCGM
jgi:predicted CopG family antitoxin